MLLLLWLSVDSCVLVETEVIMLSGFPEASQHPTYQAELRLGTA